MISFEPISIGQLLMPATVAFGIFAMVRANNKRAKAGEETQEILRVAVDGLKNANRALEKILTDNVSMGKGN